MRNSVHNYLTNKHIAAIAGFMPVYRWAVTSIGGGLTPLMLAVLHFREAALRKTSKIPGGPFQMDPGGAGDDLRAQNRQHAEKVCQRYGISVQDTNIETNFTLAVLVAADWLKWKSRGKPLSVRNRGQIERVADAFWGYNGRSSWHTPDETRDRSRAHWRYSPYVSNDPKRGVCLRLRGTMPDGKGQRIAVNRIERRPGALVLYRELQRRLPEIQAAEKALA